VKELAVRLRTAMLTGRRRPGVRGAGAPVKRRSDGYEFAELRGYVPGDDPRRIDWAATARAGALQTRVVFEDHALTLAAALDAAPSMFVGRTRSNYDLAGEAAAVWYGAAIDDDRCARVEDGRLVFVPGLRGRTAARLCTERRETRGASFANALDTALAVLPRDAHLLIVSDFLQFDALEPRLRACAARFESTAMLTRDPWHAGLPLGGFVRFRDAASGTTARAYVGKNARARYVEAVAARERRILHALHDCGLRVGEIDETNVADALFEAFGLVA
jgi:uncharacterized protein (DUF58 family)